MNLFMNAFHLHIALPMATNKAYSYQMFELVYEACTVKSFYLRVALLLDFSLTVKAAPHEYVIRTRQP